MSTVRQIPRGILAAIVGVVVLAVVGGLVLVLNSGPSKHQTVKPSGSTSLPKARLVVAHLHHGRMAFGHHVHVKVRNGTLSNVRINQPGLGRLVGHYNKTSNRWHSKAPLVPSSHVKATITYIDLAHHTKKRVVSFRTPAAKKHFSDLLSPAGGVTVGIASPVIVTFDQAIPASKRAAVEGGLSVTSKGKPLVGAWHWMSDQVAHWREPKYWKSGTHVTVSSDLQGVNLGHGVWGVTGRHSTSFSIGAAHISEADQATHTMKVYDNGKLIKTFPISTGREQYPTMDGVHIALQKNAVIEMDSATVGIPKGNPDYYDETVYWDVRISNGGEFVHAAPWSVGEQGFTNVSHGCVNLSTTNAEWFYNWARDGDVVDIYNGVRPPETGDAGTADWNMSWKKWLAGDAAPTAAAKAVHARMPFTYEPGRGPVSKAHHAAKKRAHHAADAQKHASHHAKHAHHAKHTSTSNSSY